jgi:hypothetical protein
MIANICHKTKSIKSLYPPLLKVICVLPTSIYNTLLVCFFFWLAYFPVNFATGDQTSDGAPATAKDSSNPNLVAHAGEDKIVWQPINSVALQGTGNGNDESLNYEWTQLGGPAATIVSASPTEPSVTITGLTIGNYKFRLTVKDKNGNTASDDNEVIVLAARTAKDPVLLSMDRLSSLKAKIKNQTQPTYSAYLKLKSNADAQLDRQPQAPEEWYVPAYYKNPDGHTKAKACLADDANNAYGLALMYSMTGNTNYAVASARLIDGWATTLKTMSTKDDSKLSFSYHFPAFIFAADLIRSSPAWADSNQKAFEDFLRNKAIPMNTMGRQNNWGNWGLVLYLSANLYLNNESDIVRAHARWNEFIETEIAEDGHLPAEVIRNNNVGEHGLWYSNFCLMPQTIAAEMLKVNGFDPYNYVSPHGRTLKKAYEILIPWVEKPSTFPYYKGNDPKGQQATNYISYWEILNVNWPNPVVTEMLKKSRPLSAQHSTPYLTFTHGQ